MSDVEVLVADLGTPGGVTAWDSDFSSRSLVNNTAAAATFSSVSNFSAVTASAGGRVYGLEGGVIVEWEWEHGNRSFTRLGTVDTDING